MRAVINHNDFHSERHIFASRHSLHYNRKCGKNLLYLKNKRASCHYDAGGCIYIHTLSERVLSFHLLRIYKTLSGVINLLQWHLSGSYYAEELSAVENYFSFDRKFISVLGISIKNLLVKLIHTTF